MSNITFIDDYRAYPIESVDPICLGPLDAEWQPSAAHVAVVGSIHTIASAGVAIGIVMAIAVLCLAIGG